jgi:cytochrome P450
MTATGGAPVSGIDAFSDDFLTDPYPFHEELREAGAVVWLEHYGIFASARHAEVHAGLTNWETFCSAAGVGIDDFRRTKPFRPPSLILEADPPLHTRSRTVLNRALSAKAMAGSGLASKTPPRDSRTTSSSADASTRSRTLRRPIR